MNLTTRYSLVLYPGHKGMGNPHGVKVKSAGLWSQSELKLLSYLPTPPLGQDMTQGQFLSGV